LSADGSTLAVARVEEYGGSSLSLWDVTDPHQPGKFVEHPSRVSSGEERIDGLDLGLPVDMVFLPGRHALAYVDFQSQLSVLDYSDPALLRQAGPVVAPGDTIMREIAVSPDGASMVTGRAGGAVLMWDLADRWGPRLPRPPFPGGEATVVGMAFADDARSMVVARADGSAAALDLTAPEPTTSHTLAPPSENVPSGGVALGPDAATLAVVHPDGAVTVTDLRNPTRTGRLTGPFATGPAAATPRSVAFAPDGTLLVGAYSMQFTDPTLTMWNVADPVARGRRTGRSNAIRPLRSAPTARRCCSPPASSTRSWT
jgi:WD40 repeat protein